MANLNKTVVVRKTIVVYDPWPKVLGRMIHATEQRVAYYKKAVGQAYKNKDQELVTMFKEFRKDEEKHVKRLRWEKTCWNYGTWEWAMVQPEGGKIQG